VAASVYVLALAAKAAVTDAALVSTTSRAAVAVVLSVAKATCTDF